MPYDTLSDVVQRRLGIGAAMFDALPDVVQYAMVSQIEQNIASEARECMLREEAEARERVLLEEIETARPMVEDYRQRQVQRERTERGLAITLEQMRTSGFVERIGLLERPVHVRLNRIEMYQTDISCEFPQHEKDPVSYLGGYVVGFRRATIEGLIPQMQEVMDRARAIKPVQRSATGYILFHLWSEGTRRAGTRAISLTRDLLSDIAELFKALEDELLYDIDKVKAGYEYVFKGESKSYLHFYFRANYYPEPKSIDNWGTEVHAIEKRECFDIFTANDDQVDCVVQVARRLWGDTAMEKTVDQIIQRAQGKVCIVKPHSYVKDISTLCHYSDLVVELRSPIKSLSVIDPTCIYLLHYNQHVGLLENMRQPKRHRHYTSFRPLVKFPNTKKVTMCFDIECYFDPHGDQKHVPYLCCACFIYDDAMGNIMEFEGADCVAQMLDYAVGTVHAFQLDHIELVAHNGGAYDFHYLLTAVYNPGVIKKLLIRHNRFISFEFKHDGVTFTIKDSFNFLGCSLQSAATSFLGEQDRKTDFPHHEVKTARDLQKIFQEWLSVDRHLTVNIEKDKMLVTFDDVITYKDHPQNKTLLDWSKTYCTNDVLVLAKVWLKFKATVNQVFKCQIVDQTLTLAGLSFRLFEAHLPTSLSTHKGHGQIRLYHPDKETYHHMRHALIGGRCISLNGIYKDMVCLDVKSLYPAAMAYYDQPYGQFRKVIDEVPIELGIYYCNVYPVDVAGHGFFPLKYQDKVQYSKVPQPYQAWYTSVDMDIGRKEGHTIKVCPFEDNFVGYSWKHKGKIFKDYIEGILYELKLLYERTEQPEQRHVIKIIMNALWGKFAQAWYDTKYKIEEESSHNFGHKGAWYKIFDTDWFIVKYPENRTVGSKPLQNGIFTLSWARYHLFLLWQHSAKKGTQCIYSDTDSLILRSQDLLPDATFELNGIQVPVIGSQMGQLEIEHTFHELICVGKKQYIGKYGEKDNPKYKKRFKGVPQQHIVPQMYTHLLESLDHTAEVQFLKFKREWGCVSGYIESKHLRQT